MVVWNALVEWVRADKGEWGGGFEDVVVTDEGVGGGCTVGDGGDTYHTCDG